MDNKIYINLKRNLEDKVYNRCYKDYGYIVDIFKIDDYNDGVIEAENPFASAIFDVTFSCRICRPVKNTQIICKINRINKILATLENGPILVIITNDRINDKVFFIDNNNNLRYRKDNISYVLKENDFVIVTIKSFIFHNTDTKMKTIGFLDDIASKEDIENFYEDIYYSK